ncbi:MAG TPA: VOC family protein [Propionicimonas sp.]|jgi:catechol 2,3-dioxygenase|nr:VOC family protein [Propionicimonas sp.]
MNRSSFAGPAETISAATAMDAVTLRVGDLAAMTGYYRDAFALEPLADSDRDGRGQVVLGRTGVPLVRLAHTPGLPAVDPGEAGLFHTALLFEDAASLAATVYRAAGEPRSRFVGSADHGVSEAFYFTDPEGNGVELYVDRDRSQWAHVDGQLQMFTHRLDPRGYLEQHLSEAAVAGAGTSPGRVGHVHLQVGDLTRAREFYVDTLGFEPTLTTYPGALFVSAGGYHHHLAMNTWNSAGAGPRAARLGLAEVAVTVPDRAELDALAARLTDRGLAHVDDGRAVTVADPWGTPVKLAVAGSAADALA